MRRRRLVGLPERLEGRTLFAAITGSVYLDANNTGVREDGETGLIGWQVYLDQDNSATLTDGDLTATTDTSGNFSFTSLPAGTYHVREMVQPGFVQTAPHTGVVELTMGVDGTHRADFGNRQSTEPTPTPTPTPVPTPTPTPTNTASIRGNVFNDVSNDGTRQDGEPGLASRVLYLYQWRRAPRGRRAYRHHQHARPIRVRAVAGRDVSRTGGAADRLDDHPPAPRRRLRRGADGGASGGRPELR